MSVVQNMAISAINVNSLTSTPMKELSLLVDDLLVKQATIAGFKEGIIGYWPPKLDREVEYIVNGFCAPNKPYSYVIINGDYLKYKYLALIFGERFLLLALDKRAFVERIGENLLEILREMK